MKSTFRVAGVNIEAEFEIEPNGAVNYSEVNIGGQWIDDGFLSEVVERQLAERCREYALLTEES